MKKNIQKSGLGDTKHLRNYILGGVCGGLAIASIFLSLEVATSGVEVAELEKTQKLLSDKKRDLEEAFVVGISASELHEKSAGMGFVKPVNLVYISQDLPVAKLP